MLGERRRMLGAGPAPKLMRNTSSLGDNGGDPMEGMGNLFDLAIIIGVGFMVMSLSSFGLSEILDKGDVTIVKNPGASNMEIITKKAGKIERLKTTQEQAQGSGQPIGTVYRLQDGRTVWVPDGATAPQTLPPTGVPQTAPVVPDPNAVAPTVPAPTTVPTTTPAVPATTTF